MRRTWRPPNRAPTAAARMEALHTAQPLRGEYQHETEAAVTMEEGGQTYLLYIRIWDQLMSAKVQKTWGWIWMAMLKFWWVWSN